MKHVLAPIAALLALALASPLALAQKKYDPGATDKEIKVGNINPYSGPASAYGTIGKTIGAYFTKVNEEGGVNGRKINTPPPQKSPIPTSVPSQLKGDPPFDGLRPTASCAFFGALLGSLDCSVKTAKPAFWRADN